VGVPAPDGEVIDSPPTLVNGVREVLQGVLGHRRRL